MSKNKLIEAEVITEAGKRKGRQMDERFLKGPIPIRNIARAATLPGQSLSLYVAIIHQTDLTRRDAVTLPKGLLEQFGISRDAKSRGIKALEGASLIQVQRAKGRSARVSLSASNGRAA
jgi:hypothetical protein